MECDSPVYVASQSVSLWLIVTGTAYWENLPSGSCQLLMSQFLWVPVFKWNSLNRFIKIVVVDMKIGSSFYPHFFFWSMTFRDLSLLVSWSCMMYWSKGWVGVSRRCISSVAVDQVVVSVTEIVCGALFIVHCLGSSLFDPHGFSYPSWIVFIFAMQDFAPLPPVNDMICRSYVVRNCWLMWFGNRYSLEALVWPFWIVSESSKTVLEPQGMYMYLWCNFYRLS